MLETPEERTKLLKAGFIGRAIEELYIKCNDFKVVRFPPTIELIELDFPQNKGICADCEIAVECIQSFCAEGAFLC